MISSLLTLRPRDYIVTKKIICHDIHMQNNFESNRTHPLAISDNQN